MQCLFVYLLGGLKCQIIFRLLCSNFSKIVMHRLTRSRSSEIIQIFLTLEMEFVSSLVSWQGMQVSSTGVTAVAHGYLFMHWATIWVKNSETLREVQSERKNTRLHAWTLYYIPLHYTGCSLHMGGRPQNQGYSAWFTQRWHLPSKIPSILQWLYFTVYNNNEFHKLLQNLHCTNCKLI